MKNKIVYILKSKIKLKITGKNINRFILRLNNNNIDILNCNSINKNETNITIYYSDYKKLNDIKTIYNIETLDTFGIIKIKKKLSINKYLILFIILGFISLKILSNIIFNIDIIYNDKEIINFLKTELKQYGIKEKSIKKNYNEIQKIKEEILNKYKDKIEWLEIETKGTKYIVRLELRKINEKKEQLQNRNIVAKKDAIIKEIKAKSGQVTKEINNYVKKGDIIISGDIYVDEQLKTTIPAEGSVYGETWYEVKVTYPFVYYEEKETNNKKTIYSIKLFNKNIELFNFNPFKKKKSNETVLLKSNVFPISLIKQEQTEKIIIDQILTTDEALNKALEKGLEQVKNNLKESEYIINYKILNTNIRENELELNIFFSIYEDITDYQIITKEDLNVE